MGRLLLARGIGRWHGAALAVVVAVAAAVPIARSAGLVADLSHHLVAITTAFSGTEVLLFGALETPGSDVAVVVRGPDRTETVRRKGRIGFIWLNTHELTFEGVPEYYAVAASRPLDELAPPGELARYEIGLDNLRLEPEAADGLPAQTVAGFRRGLIRNRLSAGLYAERVA
jgi:uncharacterized protein (TIGR02186 family)